MLFELKEHWDKIKNLTNYSDYELDRMVRLITHKIRFINVNLIPSEIYDKSELLTHDLDEDDCEFVALTNHIRGKLWSGDKRLIKGLLNKIRRNLLALKKRLKPMSSTFSKTCKKSNSELNLFQKIETHLDNWCLFKKMQTD